MCNITALIIDDTEEFRTISRSMLETAGLDVEVASSGNEGLALAQQQRFHLICCSNNLSDISASDFVGNYVP